MATGVAMPDALETQEILAAASKTAGPDSTLMRSSKTKVRALARGRGEERHCERRKRESRSFDAP